LRNPYIIDRPLDGQDLFFDRERELSALLGTWERQERLVLLYGKPRIGKTSLLDQLLARCAGDTQMVIAPWSEDANGAGPLVDRLEAAVLRALAERQFSVGAPLAALRAWLQAGEERGRRIVALDGLSLAVCSGLDWPAAVQELDALLRGGPLLVILAIEARPEECRPVDPRLRQIVLGGFTLDDTEDLLLMPARGALTLDLDSMRRIYALTGGEPYLVQLYGHVLFERRAERGWAGLIETEQAVDQVTEWAAQAFAELWQRCSARARIVLCVFSEGIGTHGMASADDIRRRLLRERVDMPLKDVELALEELAQRDLVERMGGGLYRFRNALFLRWLRHNQSLVETVHRSRDYRRQPRPTVPAIRNRRFDWVGLSLWVVIALLVLAIGSVWRARETRIVWTSEPPTATPLSPEQTTTASAGGATAPEGEIAYMAKAETGQDWDLYVMQADGLDPVRLTDSPGDDTGPSWSSDGQRIAFVSDRDGNREIYVMNADGSDPVNLTQHPAEDWTPAWSPDGSQIAFASFRDGNWEIYLMDADGGNQRRLTRAASADYAPAWSPAGDRLAFVSDRSGNLDIYLMAVDGSDLRALTTDEATDQAPAWSPDGRQLLWESYRDANMEIMAMEVDKGEPRNLTQDAYANDHGGSWAPSGGMIAYFSNRDGGWDIYTLDLRTGRRTNLTNSATIEQYPAFRP